MKARWTRGVLAQGSIVRHSKIGVPNDALGHFRQIDTLPTHAACPLRSDRVQTSAPQRIDVVCQKRDICGAEVSIAFTVWTSTRRGASIWARHHMEERS